MKNKIITPKITILIPTRNKAKNLDNTLRRLVIAVKNSVNLKTSDIEIIVSDNNSNDNTKKVSLTWLKNEKYIKYILQDKASSSAEESLLNSLKYANGEYIWFCCDDDFVKPDSINILYDSIKLAQSDLIIFGFKRFYLGNIFNNFETYSDIIQYDKGKDLFQDFGFISIPSLIPCLCIRNGSLNEETFYQFIKTSKIYSHSFALMASFYNKKCSLINKELIIYNVPNQTKYFYNIGNAYKKELSYHAWTLGLVSLIEDLSNKINMPIKELAIFNEVQPIMEGPGIKYIILWTFIIRSSVLQINEILDLNYSKYHLKKQTKNILNFIKGLESFFFKIKDIEPQIITNFLDLLEELTIFIFKSNDSYKAKVNILKVGQKLVENTTCYEFNYFSEDLDNKKHDHQIPIITRGNIIKFLNNSSYINFNTNLIKNINNQNILTILILITKDTDLNFFSHNLENCFDIKRQDIEFVFVINQHIEFQENELNWIKKINNSKVINSFHNIANVNDLILNYFNICNGKYIWALDGKSIFIRSSIKFVVSAIKNLEEKIIIFNCLNIDAKYDSLTKNQNIIEITTPSSLTRKHNNDTNISFDRFLASSLEEDGLLNISRYIINKELLSYEKLVQYRKLFLTNYCSLFILDSLKNRYVKHFDLSIFARCAEDFHIDRFKTSKNINELNVEFLLYLSEMVKEGKISNTIATKIYINLIISLVKNCMAQLLYGNSFEYDLIKPSYLTYGNLVFNSMQKLLLKEICFIFTNYYYLAKSYYLDHSSNEYFKKILSNGIKETILKSVSNNHKQLYFKKIIYYVKYHILYVFFFMVLFTNYKNHNKLLIITKNKLLKYKTKLIKQ